MAQRVKGLTLLLQRLGLLLWQGFDPWPRNFHMPQVWPKKKKKKEKNVKNIYSLDMRENFPIMRTIYVLKCDIWKDIF